MKAKIKNTKKKRFNKFKLIINVENIEELKNLHNRFNLSFDTIEKELGNDWCSKVSDFDVFELLNNQLDEYTYLNLNK